MDQLRELLVAAQLTLPAAPPARFWLDALPWLTPSPLATRWLLLADLAVIGALALRSGRPLLTFPAALVGAFLVLNALGMLLTDFFGGLLAFHILTGIVAMTMTGRLRWLGAGLLVLTLLLAFTT